MAEHTMEHHVVGRARNRSSCSLSCKHSGVHDSLAVALFCLLAADLFAFHVVP